MRAESALIEFVDEGRKEDVLECGEFELGRSRAGNSSAVLVEAEPVESGLSGLVAMAGDLFRGGGLASLLESDASAPVALLVCGRE